MTTIYLKEICGIEVLSRSNVRKLYDLINQQTESICMRGVTFISRSVADELCNISDKFTDIKFTDITEDVDTMLSIVRKGRGTKREYSSKAKISVTYNCRTMDDLRNALLSFGR